jgi:hypothetical protein
LIHVVNGPILAGEGIMIGTGRFLDLALVTCAYIATMVGCLMFTPLGHRLDGIMWSILLSSIVQQIGVVGHYLKVGPLAAGKDDVNGLAKSKNIKSGGEDTTDSSSSSEES